jgi:hypothetical protein
MDKEAISFALRVRVRYSPRHSVFCVTQYQRAAGHTHRYVLHFPRQDSTPRCVVQPWENRLEDAVPRRPSDAVVAELQRNRERLLAAVSEPNLTTKRAPEVARRPLACKPRDEEFRATRALSSPSVQTRYERL